MCNTHTHAIVRNSNDDFLEWVFSMQPRQGVPAENRLFKAKQCSQRKHSDIILMGADPKSHYLTTKCKQPFSVSLRGRVSLQSLTVAYYYRHNERGRGNGLSWHRLALDWSVRIAGSSPFRAHMEGEASCANWASLRKPSLTTAVKLWAFWEPQASWRGCKCSPPPNPAWVLGKALPP